MADWSPEAEAVLAERFGKDSVLALATVEAGIPHVRSVNALYDGGAFYVLTHGLSNKMRQIAAHPVVALCGDWFTIIIKTPFRSGEHHRLNASRGPGGHAAPSATGSWPRRPAPPSGP